MPTIPYAKQSWTDGSGGGTPISAARLAVLENGIYEVSLAPAVRVYHNANQSITSATVTTLAFNTERFDTTAGAADTQHDTAVNNSRLTCRYAGKYIIGANANWASNPTTAFIVLRLNGTTQIASHFISGNYPNMNLSTLYDLAVNDYVEVRVNQTSGGAINITAAGNDSPEFWMVRVA